jgi:hypothetical protein
VGNNNFPFPHETAYVISTRDPQVVGGVNVVAHVMPRVAPRSLFFHPSNKFKKKKKKRKEKKLFLPSGKPIEKKHKYKSIFFVRQNFNKTLRSLNASSIRRDSLSLSLSKISLIFDFGSESPPINEDAFQSLASRGANQDGFDSRTIQSCKQFSILC